MSGGLNMKALNDVQKGLDAPRAGANGTLFYASKMKAATLIRLLPPLPKQDGVYFTMLTKYWIDKDSFLSLETWGESCPFSEELKAAKDSNDPDIKALANKISKKVEYLMPIILFDDEYGEKPNEKNPQILGVGKMLMTEINKIVTHRNYQPDITDRESGFNIEINKKGSGLDTVYTAMGDIKPSSMNAKFYAEGVIPDVLAYALSERKTPEFLRAKIRNYLYGEDVPAELSGEERKPKADKEEQKKPDRFSPDAEKPKTPPARFNPDEQEQPPFDADNAPAGNSVADTSGAKPEPKEEAKQTPKPDTAKSETGKAKGRLLDSLNDLG